MDVIKRSRTQLSLTTVIALATIFTLGLFLFLRRKRREGTLRVITPRVALPLPRVQGLSEAEATARRSKNASAAASASTGARAHFWRKYIFSIFNLNMLGLSFVMMQFGDWLSALLNLGLLCLNIGLNVTQERLARKRLDQLALLTRPWATVIRDGTIKSIDPDDIVVGDALVVGIGDQVFADGVIVGDGQILVEESTAPDEGQHHKKGVGDRVYSGSFCTGGRAVYEVKSIPALSYNEMRHIEKRLTPLQHLLKRTLLTLLVIVLVSVVLAFLLYLNSSNSIFGDIPKEVLSHLDSQDFQQISAYYQGLIGILFGISPTGLFFAVIVRYIVGAAQIARLGVLVRRVQSVESLAQVEILCVGISGILTGTQVRLNMIHPPTGYRGPDENRVRHLLGDFACSISSHDTLKSILAPTFAGNRRRAYEEMPFLSPLGWSGIVLNDDDMRGVYVLGESQVLQPYLATDTIHEAGVTAAKTERRAPDYPVWRRFTTRVVGLWKGAKQGLENGVARNLSTAPSSAVVHEIKGGDDLEESSLATTGERSRQQETLPKKRPARFRNRLWHRVRPARQTPEIKPAETAHPGPPALLFAYHPTVGPLHDASGYPQLPPGLIPLCSLHTSHEIRSEARTSVQEFVQAGVEIKILSSEPLDTVVSTAEQLGLVHRESPLRVISGSELAALPPQSVGRAVLEATAFGDLTPQQKGEVVRILCKQGKRIATVGEAVRHVPALKGADLSVVTKGAGQAALSIADIVLLNDSLEEMPAVLKEGQRILNGLLDLLKLSFTRSASLLLLALAIQLLGSVFPYSSKQSAIIGLVTLTLPMVPLTWLAKSGELPRRTLRSQLTSVVLPAAFLTTVAALAVFEMFRQGQGILPAKLAVTYTLVLCGLLLVIFIRPPVRGLNREAQQSDDWRPTFLIVGLLVAFLVFAHTWLASYFFDLAPLQHLSDYAVIGAVAIIWSFALWIALRFQPGDRMLDWFRQRGHRHAV